MLFGNETRNFTIARKLASKLLFDSLLRLSFCFSGWLREQTLTLCFNDEKATVEVVWLHFWSEL